jgi:nitrogen fixation/metabolism regulation signal transduction histidine kinase
MPRFVRYGLIGALALAGVLLFVLASASGNSRAFERNYPILLAANASIALLMFTVVLALAVRLLRRVRRRRFGARLMARFAVAFALMGIVPGVLVYVVSSQFLMRSIESWFNVKVEGALESGLALARAVLEEQRDELRTRARTMALELADVPPPSRAAALERLRERHAVAYALLLDSGGRVLAASGPARLAAAASPPPVSALRGASAADGTAVIEGDELSTEASSGLRTRAIVPVGDAMFLQITQPVVAAVGANAQLLRTGYGEYQELSLSRQGLQRIYRLTLTLTLLLAMFAAIATGMLLAGSMTAPLVELAAGTRAVAEGDFRPVREFAGNDELNLLPQAFNAMTRQLGEARTAVEARSRELEAARAYLERLLANLSAGVLVLDQRFGVVTANSGASRILGVPLPALVGSSLHEEAGELARQLAAAFRDQDMVASPKDSWQRQIQVARGGAAPGSDPLALLVRGSRLPLEGGLGYVVVFDDITQVISAQRAVAWGEVARRLAHEIKNPLTPIQLAAERLRMKLVGGLGPEQAQMLVRGTDTIVQQVAAMKRMVDEFRDYARLPVAHLEPLDLNALVEEVCALYGADVPVGERDSRSAPARLELDLDAGLPMVLADGQQMRQVIHNLVGNALESIGGAHDALPEGTAPARPGRVVVRTEAVESDEPGREAPGARSVRLSVEDDGPGFPANILRRAFEPYVTTKQRGTGLGLALVKKIIDEHSGRVELLNRAGPAGGATVTVLLHRLAG